MDIKNIVHDDDAVSPVIGVILMVAITVILAAVIATFVLGLGDSLSNTAPQATFSYDFDNNGNADDSDDLLTITHNGGDSLTLSTIQISVNGTDALDSDGADYDDAGTALNADGTGSASVPGGPVTAGNQYVLEEDGSASVFSSGDTARVVWTSSQGGDSAIISSSTI